MPATPTGRDDSVHEHEETGEVLDRATLDGIRSGEGGDALLQRMARVYLETTEASLRSLDDAAERADWEVVYRTCHSLKSSSAMVGALAFSRLMTEIEGVARRGDGVRAAELLRDVPRAHERVRGALAELGRERQQERPPAEPQADRLPLVLTVDDETTARALIRLSLETAGFRVIEAQDGEQALARCGADHPDLVLLDVRMPGMDGFATCQAIRRLPGGDLMPVVMLTGDQNPDTIRQAYESGATDFEAKTVSPVVLAQRIRYILRTKEMFDALRESESRLGAAQRLARVGNWEWDPATTRHRWSRETFRLLGYAPEAVRPGHDVFLARVHPDDAARVADTMETALRDGEPYVLEYRVVLPGGDDVVVQQRGERLPAAGGTGPRLAGTVQDITERRRAEEQIRRLAYYDPMTGLPNRTLFLDRLSHATAEARRRRVQVALLFGDLDNFKRVNDSLGHAAGDALLLEAGARLGEAVRSTDTVTRVDPRDYSSLIARLGGDEFVILLSGIARGEDAARVTRRILDAFQQPFEIAGREVRTTMSIGIAIFPRDGDDAGTLLKHADAALYAAKDAGRDNFQFFDAALNAKGLERMALESALRRGIERGEFTMYYQPLVDRAGRTVAAEGLLRWRNPDIGLVPAQSFISVADESGLIIPIGEWTLREICRQQRAWAAAGADLLVGGNLSGRHLHDAAFAKRFARVVGDEGAEPGRLFLEVTENAVLDDVERATQVLREIQGLGVQVYLDDFGTGFSSLSHLRQFRADVVKIDRSFVRDIELDPAARTLVEGIAALATKLGMRTVAEGVENARQRDILLQFGIDAMQGYLFGHPAPPSEVVRETVGG